MANAGDLVANLLINTKQFEQALGGAQNKLMGFVSFAKKALGGLAVGLGIRESIMAAEESEVALNKLTNAVENQGAALGVTTEEMVAHANALQLVTNFNDEATMGAYELAASFGTIKGDNLKELVRLSADVATAMGTDITAAAGQLSRALAAPANATKILKSMGIVLDKDVAASLKRMTDAGDLAGAQLLILGEVSQRYTGRAEAGASQTKIMSNNFGELAESLGRLINPLLKPLVDITKSISANAELAAKVIASLVFAFGVYKVSVWASTAATITFSAILSKGKSLTADAAIITAAASVAFVGMSASQELMASSTDKATESYAAYVDELGRTVSFEDQGAFTAVFVEQAVAVDAATAALQRLETELADMASAGQDHTDEFATLMDEYINATDPIDDVTKAFDLQAEAVKRLKAEESAYLNERKSAADILKGIENDITGIVFGDEAKRKEELQDQGKNPKEIESILDAEKRRDRLKSISDKAKKDFETSLFNPEVIAKLNKDEAERIANIQAKAKSLTETPADALARQLEEFKSAGMQGDKLAGVAQALLDQTGLFDKQEPEIRQRGALTAVSGMDAIAAVNQFNAEQDRIKAEAEKQRIRDEKAAKQRADMIEAVEKNGLAFNKLTGKIEVAGGVK